MRSCLSRASQGKQWKCLRICLAGCAPHTIYHRSMFCVSFCHIHTHPTPPPPPLIPLVSLCGCRRRRMRAFTASKEWFQLVTCQLSARVAILFFFFIFLFCSFARSVISHQTEKSSLPPSSMHSTTTTTPSTPATRPTTTMVGKKTPSKENGAVVDCYKCMIGGECLLACRVIIIFVFAISRAHTILYCCRTERVVVYL